MAFHLGNLGSFGEGLRRWADADGYVPQAGDLQESFRYPAGEFGEEEWREWCSQAAAATERAEASLRRWRLAGSA